MKISLKNILSSLGLAGGMIFSGFALAMPGQGIFETKGNELRFYANPVAEEFTSLIGLLKPSEILRMKQSLFKGNAHTLEVQEGRAGYYVSIRGSRLMAIPGKGHPISILSDYVHSLEASLFFLNGGVAVTGPVAEGLRLALARSLDSSDHYFCEFVKFKVPAYPGQGFSACLIFP